MLKRGHDPPTVLACYDFMAGWPMYQNRELYMMEVQGQIDKFAKRRRDVRIPKPGGDSEDQNAGWTVIDGSRKDDEN